MRPQDRWVLLGWDSGRQGQGGKVWSTELGLTRDLDQREGSDGSVEEVTVDLCLIPSFIRASPCWQQPMALRKECSGFA